MAGPTTKMWVVIRDIDYEGSNVLTVCSSMAKAVEFVERYVVTQKGDTFVRDGDGDVWEACDVSVRAVEYDVDGDNGAIL